MKFLIAVPSFDTKVDVDCVKSIYDLDRPYEAHVDLEFVTGYDCAKARNDIAKKAMDGDYDYVFMVDSDIVLPKNALVKLLLNQTDICFGVYPRKYKDEIEVIKAGKPYVWVVYKAEEANFEDVVEVKAAGFGCALIDTDVFKKISFPYFKYETYEDGSLLSEDYYFCEKAKDYGYTIYADFGVRCGHIGRFTKKM